MDVFELVFRAIADWSRQIAVTEIRMKNIEKTLKRWLLQEQFEGCYSLMEIGEMEKICQLWIDLLHSIGDKEDVIQNLLLLFYHKQISLYTTMAIIKTLSE